MKTFKSLIADILPNIKEVFPWDLEEKFAADEELLLIDITEAKEFNTLHIKNSINVPRGVLESGCDWGYEDTIPELAAAREKEVIVICRSGNRSALAAHTMQLMGYTNVSSLKTGLRGWFDYEQPLFDAEENEVNEDDADAYFSKGPRADQMEPS